MSKPQPIATVGVTQDIQDWFDWASKLVTGIAGSAEWTPAEHQKIDVVLASTVHSLVDENGRRKLANSRDPIGAVLQYQRGRMKRLDNHDAVPVLQDMAVYLLHRIAEHAPQAAFDAAEELRDAIEPHSETTRFLDASLALLKIQIAEDFPELPLTDFVSSDAEKKDAFVEAVEAGRSSPPTPQTRLARELYTELMAGSRNRVLQAA